MTSFDAESLDRTAKILIDSGQSETFQAAIDAKQAFTVVVVVGADAVSHGHQVAAVTAVTCATRAFGRVQCVVATPDIPCVVAWHEGQTLSGALADAGGTVTTAEQCDADAPVLVIGDGNDAAALGAALQISWRGWSAQVSTNARRYAEDAATPLAPAASAALAVAEAFGRLTDRPPAGFRDRSLSLWSPGTDPGGEDGPQLCWLPASAWLVGLGHLGQAYAWCLGLLPYKPGTAELVLQDDDNVSLANHSTGVLVDHRHVGEPKTRVLAAALERVGFTTRIVERRFGPAQRRADHEPQLAFFGVDNVAARRAISDSGFELAIDVGLGSGPTNYTAVALKTFPAHGDSTDVAAWTSEPADSGTRMATGGAAYQHAVAEGADACGVVVLAGRSAAASFVGVLAATLAVSEALRVLHGESPSTAMNFDAGVPRVARLAASTARPRVGAVTVINADS